MHSSKFEPGDFIRCLKWVPGKDKIFKFSKHDINFAYNDLVDIRCELWKPKHGEWCWFWNSNEIPSLRKFKEKTATAYLSYNENNAGQQSWNYCEPFIGELPTYIKE